MLTLPRTPSLWILVLVPFAAAACGERDEAARATPEAEAVQIENPGTVTGTVAFTGNPPPPEPIDMREEPACAEKHGETPMRHTVRVNDNGTLRNVFIYVREGLDRSFPTPAESKEIDQDGCIYDPHVMGLQTGQTLVVRNSDPVLHNINTRPTVNRGFNFSQPQEGMTSERSFSSPEVMIPVRCDVHGWMHAYIGVLDHPYYVVTGADGSYRIENLPPGDYVLEAWHEQYGTQTMNVTVPPNGTADASFTYSAAMAGAVVPLGKPIDPHDHHGTHTHVASAGGR